MVLNGLGAAFVPPFVFSSAAFRLVRQFPRQQPRCGVTEPSAATFVPIALEPSLCDAGDEACSAFGAFHSFRCQGGSALAFLCPAVRSHGGRQRVSHITRQVT